MLFLSNKLKNKKITTHKLKIITYVLLFKKYLVGLGLLYAVGHLLSLPIWEGASLKKLQYYASHIFKFYTKF